METSTIRTLAATSPHKFIYNVREANKRIADLEQWAEAVEAQRDKLKSQLDAVTPPAATNANPLPDAPVVEKFGREKFCAAAKVTTNGVAVKMQRHPAAVATGQKPEAKGRARFSAALNVKQ